MIVQEIVSALALQVAAGADRLDYEVTGGYASDLLSCVMAGARKGNIWVTLQAHPNVVAVAQLLNLAAVIITEGMQPTAETVAKANEHHLPLLLASEDTYRVVGHLVTLGVQGNA